MLMGASTGREQRQRVLSTLCDLVICAQLPLPDNRLDVLRLAEISLHDWLAMSEPHGTIKAKKTVLEAKKREISMIQVRVREAPADVEALHVVYARVEKLEAKLEGLKAGTDRTSKECDALAVRVPN